MIDEFIRLHVMNRLWSLLSTFYAPMVYLLGRSKGGEREEDLVAVEGALYLLFLKIAIGKYLLYL